MTDIIDILTFIKKNKIKQNQAYLFELNFKQLKAIYTFFDLKNHNYKDNNSIKALIYHQKPYLTKSQKGNEIDTWIMNIKNIYELINNNFFFKPKFTFYFEYILPENKRIDILIKNKKKSLIIECSHNYTDELLIQKEIQVKNYIKLYNENNTNGIVYINDNKQTEKQTIQELKKLK